MLGRTVVIATGACYRKPEVIALARFQGRGVRYGATHVETQLCEGEDVVVVGGGNSAGQAAVFLSQTARSVSVLLRSRDLVSSMSRYLIDRLENNARIEVLCNKELVEVSGDQSLQRIVFIDRQSGARTLRAIPQLFVMTGAAPNTGWLRGCVALDEKGFALTGRELPLLSRPRGALRDP